MESVLPHTTALTLLRVDGLTNTLPNTSQLKVAEAIVFSGMLLIYGFVYSICLWFYIMMN